MRSSLWGQTPPEPVPTASPVAGWLSQFESGPQPERTGLAVMGGASPR